MATVDHLSKGRLDFGVGRSGLPEHYDGFNVPHAESRDRFNETLEILVKAWTEERFTHEGKYFQYRNVCLTPKPFQKPHPPLRVAATTQETYAIVGRMGMPIFIAVRTTPISDLKRFIGGYHEGWREAGHPGRGEVSLIVPVYLTEDGRQAREEAEASTMHFFRSIAEALARGPRGEEAARLGRMTYDEILEELVVYGSPDTVTKRLLELRDALGYTSLSVWMNVGGRIPHERVLALDAAFRRARDPAPPLKRVPQRGRCVNTCSRSPRARESDESLSPDGGEGMARGTNAPQARASAGNTSRPNSSTVPTGSAARLTVNMSCVAPAASAART